MHDKIILTTVVRATWVRIFLAIDLILQPPLESISFFRHKVPPGKQREKP